MALVTASLLFAYFLGALSPSQIIARLVSGTDLTKVGTKTVSPTNLYYSVGRWPALIAGAFDVAKGFAAVMVVGSGRGWFAALAGALAVAGHNWSPFLRGAGGRGLSTATGALFLVCWPAAVVMCLGLAVGALLRKVIRAMGVALVLLVPLVMLTSGWQAAVMAAAVLTPIGMKTAMLKYRQRRDLRA